MIYLDHGATSFPKPPGVARAMVRALQTCANPGRGGHAAAMAAAKVLYHCRVRAAKLFDCREDQVVFTASCTQGLNMAIRTLVKPGSRVVITGFEHNAVVRPLQLLGARVQVAGRRLFDWEDTLTRFEDALKSGADAAVFTHVSNVFGYILPAEQLAALCRRYGVPFIVDAAQSAGTLPVSLAALGADFIAVPGHKGLLGPQGTGLLLCGRLPEVLMAGGTGSNSESYDMPNWLPDRAEVGTANVPGIAGLAAGLETVAALTPEAIFRREQKLARDCARMLEGQGFQVFSGAHQGGTVSFLPEGDCEELARWLSDRGIALRAGLHCAPLAHESAGTLETGTLRVSFGHDSQFWQVEKIARSLKLYKK